jgi:nucleolin
MHSIRRAALRATCSATSMAATAPRKQAASLAMQMIKSSGMRPATTLTLARQFSQTCRVAEGPRDPVVDEAIESVEQTGSTSTDAPLMSSQTEPERGRAGPTIFVSNMTFDATEEHLREAFTHYGEITAVRIGRDGRGLSRGFGFITFKDQNAADDAIKAADKSFWHGRRINVAHRKATSDRSAPREQRVSNNEPSKSLFIGNIPYETSDADLNNLFRGLDGVTDVRVAVDRNTGWPRGFAHADFADIEAATKAHERILQMTLGGRQLRVDYSAEKQSNNQRNRYPRGTEEA